MTREEIRAMFEEMTEAQLMDAYEDFEILLRKHSMRGLHEEFRMRESLITDILNKRERERQRGGTWGEREQYQWAEGNGTLAECAIQIFRMREKLGLSFVEGFEALHASGCYEKCMCSIFADDRGIVHVDAVSTLTGEAYSRVQVFSNEAR